MQEEIDWSDLFKTIESKILSMEDLEKIREENKEKTIAFCTGCYDILQPGHAVFFNQCKKFADIVIVGVGRDELIKKQKGPDRPVNPENNRIRLVAAMQDVDYTILNELEMQEGKIDFKNIITKLRPNFFILNEGDSGTEKKRELCDSLNIKMIIVPRIVPSTLKATSSTEIIEKIK